LSETPSGDIVLLLDWNPYSGGLWDVVGLGNALTTTIVGPFVADQLMATNFIPSLGVPVIHFPLHFIGHSRGASLVCEIAKRLGERSVTVDQLTLLDPHPLNQDGFQDPVGPVDGTVKDGAYENVTFVDSYYEMLGNGLTVPTGTFVNGAFIRDLDANGIESGGYDNPHSNVHLWYHGTVEIIFPFTSDGAGAIDQATRSVWYDTIEEDGAHAGYLYSLRGGGNRREVFTPLNQFNGRPPDGLNGTWSAALGVAPSSNRTSLVRTAEQRANIVELNIIETPTIDSTNFTLGAPISVAVTNQDAGTLQISVAYSFNGIGSCGLTIFADNDENSLNGWVGDVKFSLPPTGNTPQRTTLNIGTLTTTLKTGIYRIGSLIATDSGSREFYARERLRILPNLKIEWTPVRVGSDPGFDFVIRGIANAAYVLESSSDFAKWTQVLASRLSDSPDNSLAGIDVWNNITAHGKPVQFFRARYSQ
jgi:hypothetical protein